jgi:hypothetical protein
VQGIQIKNAPDRKQKYDLVRSFGTNLSISNNYAGLNNVSIPDSGNAEDPAGDNTG